MAHTCLIFPPQTGLNDPTGYPPLGLLYVAAALREAGHSVEVANLAAHPTGSIDAIPQADYYGISVAAAHYGTVRQIVEALHEQRPHSRTILGGPLCVAEPARVLHETDADYVVDGEGEQVIAGIVEGRCPTGIVHAERIDDLDALPFPARDLLPREQVVSSTMHRVGPATTLYLSRGCPYSCAFCSKIRIMQGKPVLTSPPRVAEEMEHCERTLGVKGFRVMDDAITLDPIWTDDLCTLIRGRDYRILAASRADGMQDLGLLKRMRGAGFEALSIGVESPDPAILKRINKGEDIDTIKRAFALAREADIRTHALLIFGLPGETLDSIERLKAFMREVRPDSYILSTFTPLPGSPIYRHPERFGITLDKSKYSGWFYHEPGEDTDMPEYLPPEVQAARGPLIQWLRSGVWRY